MSFDSLAPVPDDWSRALAIAAHPDDLEYGAAALVARWTGAGAQVVYLLATRGEAGIDGLSPAECARVRTDEQIASAAVVGVTTVEFLDHADGTVEPGVPLRRDIALAVRRHRPDTLLLVNHRDTWGPGRLNTPDHRHVGQAALDAVGDAGNRWIFADADGLPPHCGVREALVCGSPLATHAADVTGTVDLAVASLAEHRAYLRGLGDHVMADPEVLRDWLGQAGQQALGGGAAVTFELFGT